MEKQHAAMYDSVSFTCTKESAVDKGNRVQAAKMMLTQLEQQLNQVLHFIQLSMSMSSNFIQHTQMRSMLSWQFCLE